jgi:hypothetical protein
MEQDQWEWVQEQDALPEGVRVLERRDIQILSPGEGWEQVLDGDGDFSGDEEEAGGGVTCSMPSDCRAG